MKPNALHYNWKKTNNWSTASLLSLSKKGSPIMAMKRRAGLWAGGRYGVVRNVLRKEQAEPLETT